MESELKVLHENLFSVLQETQGIEMDEISKKIIIGHLASAIKEVNEIVLKSLYSPNTSANIS